MILLNETVDIWYISKVVKNYEVHIYIQTQKPGLKLCSKDIKKVLDQVIDNLELPTRKSIEICDCNNKLNLEMSRFSPKHTYVPKYQEFFPVLTGEISGQKILKNQTLTRSWKEMLTLKNETNIK